MLALTANGILKCDHGGVVALAPHQHWMTINGHPVLVEDDPLHRPIAACPMVTPTTPPCLLTVSVDSAASHASFVTVASRGDLAARRLCLATTSGKTNWSQLASISFSVVAAGQGLVTVGG